MGRRVVGLLQVSALLLSCAGVSGRSPARPAAEGELAEARQAYEGFCGLCPKSADCCLKSADFDRLRWSAHADPYLHAMRDHYECMRGDTVLDATLYPEPLSLSDSESGFRGAPVETDLRFICERHSCEASAKVMAAQLDRALGEKVPHGAGATLACDLEK